MSQGLEGCQDALAGGEPLRPRNLRQTAKECLAGGSERANVQRELEELYRELQNEGREEDEDVVMEALDLFTGWCNPHTRI